MIEVTLQAKLVIVIITVTVFYFFIKKTIENISSTNDDGDTIINLEKMSKKKERKK